MGCGCGGAAPAGSARQSAGASARAVPVSTVARWKVVKPSTGVTLLYVSETQARRDAAKWGVEAIPYEP